MTTGIARDLSAKLQSEIAGVLHRNLSAFELVLDPAGLGEAMLEAAVMTVRTTAATIAGYGKDRQQVKNLSRSVTESVAAQVRLGEAAGIEKTMATIERLAP